MNYIELTQLVNPTIETVKQVAILFGEPIGKIRIGGSLALALQIPEFQRPIHDIDIIIKESPGNTAKFRALMSLVQGTSYQSDTHSYTFDAIRVEGHPVNIILDSSKTSGIEFKTLSGVPIQHPSLIKAAKLMYHRKKDIKDIEIITNWEIKNNL